MEEPKRFSTFFCGKTYSYSPKCSISSSVCNSSNISTTVTLEPCRDEFNDSTAFSFHSDIRVHNSVLGALDFRLKELAPVELVVM